MKKDIHPDYHPVVFRDVSGEFAFLTRSTATPSKTIVWEDGNTYPVVDIEISSATHPFYTGQSRVVDTAGRVEKFRQRYGDRGTKSAAQKATPEPPAPEPSASEPPAAEAPTDDTP